MTPAMMTPPTAPQGLQPPANINQSGPGGGIYSGGIVPPGMGSPVPNQAPASGGKGGGTQTPSIFQQAQAGQAGAMAGTAAGMGYQPAQVQAGQIAGTDLSPYFNPFEQTVVQQSLSDIEQARQMQANQLAAQAQRAGAFGGSRSAILESQANEAAMQQAARTAANLRLGGFQQAQQMAGQDIGRQMQAALANQQAGLAGAGQRLAAAGQLGGLAQQAFGMGRGLQQDLAQQGALQQMLQQQIFDQARQQFEGYRSFPERSLGFMASALGAAPVPQTQTTSNQPGLFDYLSMGAALAPVFGFSDKRLKTEIQQVGKLPSGQNVYSWTWNDKANEIGLSGKSMGVIADETDSAFVITADNGYQMVNYGALLA